MEQKIQIRDALEVRIDDEELEKEDWEAQMLGANIQKFRALSNNIGVSAGGSKITLLQRIVQWFKDTRKTN